MESATSLFKAKCELEASVKGKLAELHKLGYTKQQSFHKLLAQIAPENVNHTLKEIDVAGAMQVYNLEREYAINALTISNELISLRRNQGLDMLQALDLLQQRVASMHNTARIVAGEDGLLDADDGPVEKRRRLSKTPCPASATAQADLATAAGAAVGDDTGPIGGGVGSSDGASASAGRGSGGLRGQSSGGASGGGRGRGGDATAAGRNNENVLRAEKRAAGDLESAQAQQQGGGAAAGAGAGGVGAAVGLEDIADFKRSRKDRQ